MSTYDDPAIDRARKHVDFEYGYVLSDGSLILNNPADVTFERLAALSEEFGTRLINVECALGPASDRSHDTSIRISGRTR